jgi:hypothetical protein
MGTRYWIVDGQQRLKTIIKYRESEFKTATSFSLEPGVKPVEANSHYHELSPAARRAFDFYSLQFCFIKNVEAQATGLIYRRFNYQVQLKFAEMLYSYESKAKEVAESFYDHTFWNTIYGGKTDRKQIFMMGLHMIFMEVMDTFANMTSPRLAEMAKGNKDDDLPPNLKKRIYDNLDGLENVFDGATISSASEIIPIYQAGLLLQEDGYDLVRSKRGCLASWYMDLREKAVVSRREGISDPIAILSNVNKQRDFWIRNLATIYAMEGALFRKDTKRTFSELDKIKAWNKQKGKCVICDKPVRISDVGHHAQAHSAGGKTKADNCILIHAECHSKIHNNPQLKLQLD